MMLRLAILFLVFAVVAGLLGYTESGSLSWSGGKIVLAVFLGLALLSLLGHAFMRRSYQE